MGKRVVTYLSDEQYEAFAKRVKRLGIDEAQMLRDALRVYLRGTYWPDNDPQHGGKRTGAGWPKGRKRKPTPSNGGVGE